MKPAAPVTNICILLSTVSAKTHARITVKLSVEDAKIPIKSATETSMRKNILEQ